MLPCMSQSAVTSFMSLRRLAAFLITLAASASCLGMIIAEPAMRMGDLDGLNGEWIYVDDRTEGRPLEQQGAPMSGRFVMRVDGETVILVSGQGSGHRDVRVAPNGTHTDVPGSTAGTFVRYRAAWKEGTFSYETEYMRTPGGALEGLIRRTFRPTGEGMIVSVSTGTQTSVALYRHPQDIAMPTPAKAAITDLSWLSGAWAGTRGTGGAISFEERWSPPKGGAMLATSRTVSRDKMSAFEFLRIVERDGGLVYIAQPNGASPTEFVLSEVSAKRAVFDNPRHDYPKRIVYELSADGGLTATIGYMKGGSPRRFEFKREGQ